MYKYRKELQKALLIASDKKISISLRLKKISKVIEDSSRDFGKRDSLYDYELELAQVNVITTFLENHGLKNIHLNINRSGYDDYVENTITKEIYNISNIVFDKDIVTHNWLINFSNELFGWSVPCGHQIKIRQTEETKWIEKSAIKFASLMGLFSIKNNLIEGFDKLEEGCFYGWEYHWTGHGEPYVTEIQLLAYSIFKELRLRDWKVTALSIWAEEENSFIIDHLHLDVEDEDIDVVEVYKAFRTVNSASESIYKTIGYLNEVLKYNLEVCINHPYSKIEQLKKNK